jgi:hypothetical protein
MSVLAVGDADGGVVAAPGGGQAPTVVVDGDVVLIFVALAFIFVLMRGNASGPRRRVESQIWCQQTMTRGS